MKELLSVRGGPGGLRWTTRFIYSIFLLFCAASYAVMTAMALSRSGIAHDHIAAYYAGNEAEMMFGKSYDQLLEVTHFHLFTMPMMLFVQGHIFLLTTWPLRLKTGLVIAAALGIALDLAAPWLIVYASTDWAWTKNAARLLMGVPFVAFAAVPLWEMWFVKPSEDPLLGLRP